MRNVDPHTADLHRLKIQILKLERELVGVKFGEAPYRLPDCLTRASEQMESYYADLYTEPLVMEYIAVVKDYLGAAAQISELNSSTCTSLTMDTRVDSSHTEKSCLENEDAFNVEELNATLIVIEEIMDLETREADFNQAQLEDEVAMQTTESLMKQKQLKFAQLKHALQALSEVQTKYDTLSHEVMELEKKQSLASAKGNSQSHSERLVELRKTLRQQQIKLGIAKREAERCNALKASIEALKTQKVTLTKRLKTRRIDHLKIVDIKNREIANLRKSDRKHERKVNVLELVNRKKEMQVGFFLVLCSSSLEVFALIGLEKGLVLLYNCLQLIYLLMSIV